jgi:hypothetical protein
VSIVMSYVSVKGSEVGGAVKELESYAKNCSWPGGSTVVEGTDVNVL